MTKRAKIMNCQIEMGLSKRKRVNQIKSIYSDQWNKTENPEITRFSTRLSRPFNRGKTVFSTTVLGQLDILMQKKEAEPLPHTMYFQKRSKSLNVRATII